MWLFLVTFVNVVSLPYRPNRQFSSRALQCIPFIYDGILSSRVCVNTCISSQDSGSGGGESGGKGWCCTDRFVRKHHCKHRTVTILPQVHGAVFDAIVSTALQPFNAVTEYYIITSIATHRSNVCEAKWWKIQEHFEVKSKQTMIKEFLDIIC